MGAVFSTIHQCDTVLSADPGIFLMTPRASGATNLMRKSEQGGARLLSQGHNSLPVNTEETSREERKAAEKEDVPAHSNSATTAADPDF